MIEATQALEDIGANEQTRRGDGGDVAAREQDTAGTVESVRFRDPKTGLAEHMIGRAIQADDDAGMLDRFVREEQGGADDADVGPLGVAEHMLEPARCDRLGVIVEEEIVCRGCGRGGAAVQHGRKIEFALVAQDSGAAGKVIERRPGGRVVPVLVNDHNFGQVFRHRG